VEGFSAGLATPLKETTLAVLFRITDVGDEWIPKKCIHEDSEVWKEGQEEGELVVTLWFAKRKVGPSTARYRVSGGLSAASLPIRDR